MYRNEQRKFQNKKFTDEKNIKNINKNCSKFLMKKIQQKIFKKF